MFGFIYLSALMFKKFTAILIVSFAYAILLGHNIIPHHHHDSAEEIAKHHITHHDHDSEHEGLGNLLSHFVHSVDSFTLPANHIIINTFSKQLLSFVGVLPNNISLNNFLIPPLLHNFFAEQIFYISPHSHPNGLRAPPTTLI